MFHAGHVDLLRVCRKLASADAGDGCGRVVVGLNRDGFVAQFKGKLPVCTYEERSDVLMACRYVDQVVENMGDGDSKQILQCVRPDFVLIGDDWAPPRNYYDQMGFTASWLAEKGITLLYVPRQRVISSTTIKDRANTNG